MKALEKFLAANANGHWSGVDHSLNKPEDEAKPAKSDKLPRIAVIGDTMIDQYFYVTVDRISPEFPIPVMKYDSAVDEFYPGGAANVAYQFKHFNVLPGLFGPRCMLGRIFDQNGMGRIVLGSRGTDDKPYVTIPMKRRFYDKEKDFPLCRMDEERPNFGLKDDDLIEFRKERHAELKEFKPYVTIYSDYDKGMFTGITEPIIDDCDPSLSIVDPKKGPLFKWKGCTIIKPNSKEAAEMSGETEWKKQADYFHDQTDCSGVVITQAGNGVVGKIGYDGYFEYYPDSKITADSVIGAGDCFVAFLAMCMAHQMDLLDAIKVAFEASRIYVQRRHNKPVTVEELHARCDPIRAKFIRPEDLAVRGYKLAFTNGVFDLTHVGHINTLQFAKSKADKLVVALNTDDSVRCQGKGDDRPINRLIDRMYVIAAFECVDFVVEFNEETPYSIIKKIKPDVLVKGGDWADDIVGSDLVNEVYSAPMIGGISTTAMIERIRDDNTKRHG